MSDASDEAKDLGDLERAVMQLIWDGGEMTAEAVRERLNAHGRSLKESTVRTVLRRLEDKGFLTHETEARTFIYRAAEPRGKVAAKAVKRIVDWFCNGSMEEVLVGLVDSKMIDQKQLQDLAKKIEKARAAKGDGKATGGKK